MSGISSTSALGFLSPSLSLSLSLYDPLCIFTYIHAYTHTHTYIYIYIYILFHLAPLPSCSTVPRPGGIVFVSALDLFAFANPMVFHIPTSLGCTRGRARLLR